MRIKLDILKLKTISNVDKMIKLIKKYYNVDIDEYDIPLDDVKTWEAFANCNTLGIFQMESNVAAPILKRVKPNTIEELSAVNAFIRPGASGVDEYIGGKYESGKLRKLDPRIDRHLADTYGAIVYQEQIMFLIAELMGINFGQADIYRRALEKPKKGKNVEIVKDFNDNVVNRAVELGFSAEVAETVRHLIIDNIGYGFNHCLSGDTVICRNRNQNHTLTIEQMYNAVHKIDDPNARLGYTYKNHGYGSGLSLDRDLKIKRNGIIDIRYEGEREAFKVILANGYSITCTDNHKFPIPGKLTRKLSELKVGDEIYVMKNDGQRVIYATPEVITSITSVGIKTVYDVEMQGPNHNLVVNEGVVTSNSHAVAYALISYWTAWFKVNYPLVYYTVMLNANLDKLNDYMSEAKINGISTLTPHVSYSQFDASIESLEPPTIRIGLNAVKGIGQAAMQSISINQPFTSINDFFERNNGKAVNKRVIDSLTEVGGFDGLGIKIDTNDLKFDNESLPEVLKLLSTLSEIKKEDFCSDEYVILSRNKLKLWWHYVKQIKDYKNPPCYAIPKAFIKGKYMDLLTVEPNDTVIFYADQLGDYELITNLERWEPYKTRCKPKGILCKVDVFKKISPLTVALLNNYDEIKNAKEDVVDDYIDEYDKLGYSFLKHPFEPYKKFITRYESVDDGEYVSVGGIIRELITRKTKNNKIFYWIIVNTPNGNVRLQMWDNDYKRYRKIIKINNCIRCGGIKGYGSVQVKEIEEWRPK